MCPGETSEGSENESRWTVLEIKPTEIPDRVGRGRERGREESATDNAETRTFQRTKTAKPNLHKKDENKR